MSRPPGSRVSTTVRSKRSGMVGSIPNSLSPVQQAIVDFTDDVVRNVRPGDASLAAVRKHLSDTQVLDLTLLIGLYMAVSRFLETTGVELDKAAIDWKTLPQAK